MKLRSPGRAVLVVFSLCLAVPSAAAGEEKPEPAVELLDGKIKQFLETVAGGEAQTAYQKLLAGSQLAKQTDAVKGLVEKTRELKARYGEYRSFERVAAKRIGSDLVILKYLYKCEHYPVVWYFTFYRTPQRSESASTSSGAWLVVIVRFDTELEKLAW